MKRFTYKSIFAFFVTLSFSHSSYAGNQCFQLFLNSKTKNQKSLNEHSNQKKQTLNEHLKETGLTKEEILEYNRLRDMLIATTNDSEIYRNERQLENYNWSVPGKKALFELYLSYTPISTIFREVPGSGPMNPIKKAISRVSKRKRDIIPENWVELAWDRVKKGATGPVIIQLLSRLKSEYGFNNLKDSIDVIREYSGLKVLEKRDMLDKLSSDRIGDFYLNLLSFLQVSPKGALAELRVSSELLEKGNIGQLGNYFKYLKDLMETDKVKMNKILSDNRELNLVNIFKVNQILERERFSEVIEIYESWSQSKIDFSQLKKLESRWVDIEPLVQLIIRFSRPKPQMSYAESDQLWNGNLEYMLRVFESALNGTFEKLKFEGYESDQMDQQLTKALLKPLEYVENPSYWKENHTMFKIINDEIPESYKMHNQMVKAEIDQYIQNKFSPQRVNVSNPSVKLILDKIIFEKRDPKEVLNEVREMVIALGRNRSNVDKLILDIVLNYILKDQEVKTYSLHRAVVFLRNVRGLINISKNQSTQIQHLKRLTNRLDYTNGGDLLVTVISNKARFMLAFANDIVICKRSSCINFTESGYNAHGLMGTVIDPNVIAMGGYHLKASHFESQSDYREVVENLKIGEAQIRFNGNKKYFEVTTTTGEVYRSKVIESGYARAHIKLGTTENQKGEKGAGLRRDAMQFENRVKQEELQTFNEHYEEFAKKLGAKTGERIQITPSRNRAGGQHSEYPYGQHINGYVIP